MRESIDLEPLILIKNWQNWNIVKKKMTTVVSAQRKRTTLLTKSTTADVEEASNEVRYVTAAAKESMPKVMLYV